MSESDKYEVLEKIGHGSFGVIRRVRRKQDGMILCRKEISYLKMSQKEREQLHAEFQILSTLRHPNIVGYYHREHLKATQDLHLYMEYCGNGDLGRVIKELQQKNQYAEESFVWSIFSQLVSALYRCHYGVDPPEVGKTVLGLGTTARPKAPTGGTTILHRDLKPENVFLGEDNSVKLGDFGLSKVLQSHDFASTYVGTPFYMSPEICAAEKYTLKSDIWSLGCIIYELCTREPPFNAKTHFQLIQRIKEGKIAPLPACYSTELFAVIKDCLRVNPDRRPDTAALLNLPVVRLMRKEKEVVEFSKTLKAKEDALNRRIREMDQKLVLLEQDKVAMRQQIDDMVRREWEVKATLEITKHKDAETELLRKQFHLEVEKVAEAKFREHLKHFDEQHRRKQLEEARHPVELSSSKNSNPHSSISSISPTEEEFPSTTDITEPESPTDITMAHPFKRSTRTPFARAQTMFAMAPPVGTPMDVDASPITIAHLSLSPRRKLDAKAPHNPSNIFAAAAANSAQMNAEGRPQSPPLNYGSDSDDDGDEIMPSPTRNIKASSKNPFTSKGRPQLHAQKSMPVHRLQSKQTFNLREQSKTLPAVASNPDFGSGGLRQMASNGALGGGGGQSSNNNSPGAAGMRRLSKIPSAAGLNKNVSEAKREDGGQLHTAVSMPGLNKISGGVRGNIQGRTLVELQQARAGGRPLSGVMSGEGLSLNTQMGGGNASPVRAFREHAAAANRGVLGEAAVWDPERDEMPSPFLVRRKPVVRT
ncbi:putative G2-specific protein kinase nim-1 [Triangularia verruculosa]|uniref:non-specific serine/threonine protein kinase n=1 Tax=Triangularia verruculosa TaxID=2587418 RepID=A0AAN6XCP2_9PEZI|nr:putative G2-specific protein kinase nim-1 [Triangularia verruculosa]